MLLINLMVSKYRKLFIFILAWLLVELLVAGFVFVGTALTNPNWQVSRTCTEWNYACLDTCGAASCDAEIRCCDKSRLTMWNDMIFFTGTAGLGLSIFIALLAVQYLGKGPTYETR